MSHCLCCIKDGTCTPKNPCCNCVVKAIKEEDQETEDLKLCKKLLALVWAHCACPFDEEIRKAVEKMIE